MTHNHLTDRMPEVARGTASWTPAEAAHLAACADCAAEWRVLRSVVGSASAVVVDAERIATGVLDRLRVDSSVVSIASRRPWTRVVIGLAAAASVALAVAVWQPWQDTPELAVAPTREPTMLPELDALFEAELEVVLATLEPEPIEPIGAVPRMGDLTDDELEQLLEEVEG